MTDVSTKPITNKSTSIVPQFNQHRYLTRSQSSFKPGLHALDSMQRVQPLISKLASKVDYSSTLVIYDLDKTLWCREAKILRAENSKDFDGIMRQFYSKYGFEESKGIKGDKPYRLIEECALGQIEQLTGAGIRVMGLTARPSNQPQVSKSLETLRSLNIRFDMGDLDITQTKHYGCSWDEGLLSVGQRSKGESLEAFLNHIHFEPDRIIFFDDLELNVKHMQSFCEDYGIEFYGFHYQGYDHLDHTLNPLVLKIQTHALLDEKIWLSDAQAMSRLEPEFPSLKL